MKTALLTVAFFSISLLGFGQLSYSPSKTFSLTFGMNESGHYDGIEFTNTGAMNVTADWQLINFDTVPGCLFDMCASGACLYKVPATGNFPALAPDELGWLKLHIQTGNTPGVNTIQFVINQSGGHAPDTLTFIINVLNNVSVKESSNGRFRVYPNPFSDVLHLDGQPGIATIYDITGQVVWENRVLTGKRNITLSSLDKGIYFLRFSDEKGITTTQRIIKN